MKSFKLKTKQSEHDIMTPFEGQPSFGAVKIESVFYSSHNPSRSVFLYDGDGDLFLFPIPGQVADSPILLDSPVTVKLPIYYLDQDGGNQIILFGEV